MSLPKIILGASLILAVPVVYADVCVAPGDVVITDPARDVIDPAVPADPVSAVADLQSLSIATPPADSIDNQTVVFTIQTGGTSPGFPPGSGIFASFFDPRQTVRGVRIEGNTSGTFSYFSYVAAANSDGVISGSLMEPGSQVPAEGSYANGVITITVKAKDIKLDAGDTLSGFNGSSYLFVGTSIVGVDGAGNASRIDDMPDDIYDRAVATSVTFSPCAKSGEAKAAESEDKSATNFGGAVAPSLLMLLLGLAGLRRRA